MWVSRRALGPPPRLHLSPNFHRPVLHPPPRAPLTHGHWVWFVAKSNHPTPQISFLGFPIFVNNISPLKTQQECLGCLCLILSLPGQHPPPIPFCTHALISTRKQHFEGGPTVFSSSPLLPYKVSMPQLPCKACKI